LNPITHFLTAWAVANTVPALGVKDRAIVTLAGVVPDIDGLGAIPDLLTLSCLAHGAFAARNGVRARRQGVGRSHPEPVSALMEAAV